MKNPKLYLINRTEIDEDGDQLVKTIPMAFTKKSLALAWIKKDHAEQIEYLGIDSELSLSSYTLGRDDSKYWLELDECNRVVWNIVPATLKTGE